MLCGTKEAIRLVTDTLNGELKIKETGRVTFCGGKITFLGREIERHGSHLRMYLTGGRAASPADCMRDSTAWVDGHQRP